MDTNPEEEVFERLAVLLGEPLVDVWRMPEEERTHLIDLLLGSGEEKEEGQKSTRESSQPDIQQASFFIKCLIVLDRFFTSGSPL